MSNLDLSKVWPEWKVDGKPLGRGSYGVVYKAVRRDHDVESFAAIKVISIPQNESEIDSLRSEGMSIDATRTYLEGVVSDFVSEIQLMESFKGVQNIVSVEDYKVVEKTDEVGWDIYIRMELLTPFNRYISDKTMSEEDVIKLGVDICTALELCAERNVIHRDIKPQNIFINQFGHFKLGDFGIARKLENVTGGLSQKGSPNYMAPEVAHSTQYDATVDLYSLGIVLYQLMNKNRLPFLDTERQLLNPNERAAALSQRLEGEPLPAPCDASPEMAEVILCASNPDPSKRFASAKAMKNALMSVESGAYTASETDLNKTMSVRHAAQTQDLNRTTSVHKAPQLQKSIQKPVDTFGGKKKSKIPVIIATIFIVVLLVGGGSFVVPRLLGNSDSTENSSVESSANVETAENDSSDSAADSKNGIYSDFDEEQIASAIEEAEVFAAEEDYEDALMRIKTAFVTYPKSEELKAKETEYTEALATQVKVKTLEEAANLAESGDYVSAIALIKNAQDTNGDDADYQTVLNTYSATYKAEVIALADSLIANDDYIGALEAIGDASVVIGDDAELSEKNMEYEGKYVTDIIEQADSLIADMKYDEAKTLLSQSAKNVTNNESLFTYMNSIDSMRPVNLNTLHIIDHSEDFSVRDGIFVDSFGNSYDGSFHFKYVGFPNQEDYAIFNLKGECTTFMGSIVACQATGSNEQMLIQIYVDNVLKYTSQQFGKTSEKIDFEVDVTGGKQLMIKAGLASGDWSRACFSIVDGKLTKNPEAVAENLEIEQQNIYDPNNSGLE